MQNKTRDNAMLQLLDSKEAEHKKRINNYRALCLLLVAFNLLTIAASLK